VLQGACLVVHRQQRGVRLKQEETQKKQRKGRRSKEKSQKEKKKERREEKRRRKRGREEKREGANHSFEPGFNFDEEIALQPAVNVI
jgi:hypothetical protein